MLLSAVMKPLVLLNPIMHEEPQTTTLKFESKWQIKSPQWREDTRCIWRTFSTPYPSESPRQTLHPSSHYWNKCHFLHEKDVKIKAQAVGGGFMFFIPTFRRERQVVEVSLVYTVRSCQGLERELSPWQWYSVPIESSGRATCDPHRGKNPVSLHMAGLYLPALPVGGRLDCWQQLKRTGICSVWFYLKLIWEILFFLFMKMK